MQAEPPTKTGGRKRERERRRDNKAWLVPNRTEPFIIFEEWILLLLLLLLLKREAFIFYILIVRRLSICVKRAQEALKRWICLDKRRELYLVWLGGFFVELVFPDISFSRIRVVGENGENIKPTKGIYVCKFSYDVTSYSVVESAHSFIFDTFLNFILERQLCIDCMLISENMREKEEEKYTAT